MTLFYKSQQSRFKDHKTGKNLWHIKLKKVGKTVGLRELAKLIAEKSSLTEGDVFNVIANLPNTMRIFLLNSRTVRLDGLGTFTLSVSSKGRGVEHIEDINPNQVTSLKCRFTPEYFKQFGGGVTRSLYEGVTFQKWSEKKDGNAPTEHTPLKESPSVPKVLPEEDKTSDSSSSPKM